MYGGPAAVVSHHCRHTPRSALIKWAANREPSHKAEAAIRSRNPARRAANRGTSLAKATAFST